MKKLDGLQALRGFAAAYVLLFHLVPVSGLGEAFPALRAVARWGFAGVDLFFVLSGFVMWHTTIDRSGSGAARTFLLKRCARIYLGYWPWLALALALFALLAPQALAGKNLIGSLLLLDIDDRRLVISVAWSLVFELYFYALFAVLLLAGRRVRFAGVAAAAIGVALFNLALLAWWPESLAGDAGEGHFFLSPFVAEFFAGSLLAAAWRADFGGAARLPVALAGLALAVVGAWFGVAGGELPAHQVQRLGSFGLAAAGLILAVAALDARLPWPRWSVALGDSSYALYLGHPLLLSLATLGGWFAPGRAPIVAAALAAAAIGAAFLYHRCIELPLYRRACMRIDARTPAEP